MERRTFLKNSILFSTTTLINPTFIFANTQENSFGIKEGIRKFTITNDYKFETTDEIIQLWVPLPLDSDYQSLVDISFEGNYNITKIVENDYNSNVLYVFWEKGSFDPELNIKLEVLTKQKFINLSNEKDEIDYSKYVVRYLEPTRHVPVNDKLKEFVAQITKDAKSQLEKARAIYNWIVTSTYKDSGIVGAEGWGSDRTIEEQILCGKCIDISSTFVCLLRNSNIPAREIYGIRAGESKISYSCGTLGDSEGFTDISGAQHSRVEFFINGIGWIPSNPADVERVRFAENLTLQDPKIKDIEKYMFGAWEMNWVAFNYARDFVLDPQPANYPIDKLAYPYAEIGNLTQEYNMKSYSYTYKSLETM